jgi:predicted RNA polymerase sigma factor
VDARDAATSAARASYGRLVAFLAARTGDVAAAEDALADAFCAAIEMWPRDGVPERPEAWLLTSARRRLIDRARHAKVREQAAATLQLIADEAVERATSDVSFPDERLKLLFICAHPAIDENARTPLMLQTVIGLDAARIASAFLASPAAMGQRLVRAKAKIRNDRIAFETPSAHDLPVRLEAVLAAIYAAYGTSWDEGAGADERGKNLAEEAIFLARLVAALLPADPEARGLLALLLYCESRRAARREEGRYVPLSEQNTRLWSRPMIEEAERELTIASGGKRTGRYQLEAAIQSVHAGRAVTGVIDWPAIALLYEGLVAIAPTVVARVGRAAALSQAASAADALAALDAIEPELVRKYQPYWAVRADVLARLDRHAEANAAYDRAVGLSEDQSVRDFLRARQAHCAS